MENEPLNRRMVKKKSKKPKRPINRWKIACITVLSLLVLSIGILAIKITSTKEGATQASISYKKPDGSKALSVVSNKSQMNHLINYYLQTYQSNSFADYHFELKNQAVLDGQVSIFSVPVKYYLYFDPFVMDNGNIQLRAKSISIGTLGVPIREVLKLVKSSVKLPEYFEVDPSEKTILVRLDQLKLKNGMSVRANKIDLVDDVIEASLYLPKSATN